MAKEKQEKTAAETPAVAEVVPDLEGEKKKVKGKKEKSHKKKAAKEKTIKASKKSKKAA
jgi:hypothetical protein